MERAPVTGAEQLNKKVRAALVCALLVWGGLAYAEIGRFLKEGELFARMMDGRPYVSDFANTYSDALLARRCLSEKVDIYDINVQNESLKKVIAPVVPELPFYSQYPPYFFALMLPLAYVSIETAWLIWVCLGVLAVGLSIRALCSRDFPGIGTQLVIAGITLSSFPAWISVELGQPSFLSLFACAATLACLERNESIRAATAHCLNLVKLQYYPAVGIIGLVLGRRRFVLSALVGAAGLFALSVAVVGLENTLNFPRALARGETGGEVSGVSAHMMQNLRGELVVLTGADSSLVHLVAMAAFLLMLVSIVWLWLREFPRYRAIDVRAFQVASAITVLRMLIFSPHAHTQDFLLVTIPSLWLVKWASERQKVDGSGFRMTALRVLIVAYPALSWVFFLFLIAFMSARLQPHFFWALVILVLVEWEMRRQLAGGSAGRASALQ